MATEIQYRVFKEVYDEESERYSNLGTRSNLYLTLITFYLGVIFLKVEDILKFANTFRVSIILFLTIGVLLVGALLLRHLLWVSVSTRAFATPRRLYRDFVHRRLPTKISWMPELSI